MSSENTVLNELKSQLVKIDRSLSNKIFIGQNVEEQTHLPYWIRLSLQSTQNNELTINYSKRNIVVAINYYRKNETKSKYEVPSVIKEKIMANLPCGNDPYWLDWEDVGQSYDIDIEGLEDEYEGFILELNFITIQQITCKAV